MTHKGWRVVKPQHKQTILSEKVLLTSTQNICFHGGIRKLSKIFVEKNILYGAMEM